MSDELVIALISFAGSLLVGVLGFIGVVITNNKSNRDMQHKIEVSQEVTKTEIKELTREVREHNNFAKRMPVVEAEIKQMKTDITELKSLHKREA